MEKTPKYGPGDCVNIEVDILETIIGKDAKTDKEVIRYKVKPSKEDTRINTMTIPEDAIQD